MNKYHNILELLYHNRDKGFIETKHLFKDNEEAKRITRELKNDGLVSFEPRKTITPKPISFKLAITRLGIEKYEEYFFNSSITNTNSNFNLKEDTIDILKRLKNGESIPLTKSATKEVSELISKLTNIGVLYQPRKFEYTCDLTQRKKLTKLIELQDWEKFLDWSEIEYSKSGFINDFSGSTIGQVNQSSEKMDLRSPITQKIVHKTANEPNKKSWIEILAWIIGIIAGLVAIYEFIIKNLIN